MIRPSYKELLQALKDAHETILDLQEDLEKKDMHIVLLQTEISELEDILYANRIFKHFD